ncbi:MAG: NAD-dependent epimerase/dehydratase family protein [Desulfocapsaceae bacterium]|nr:NAD-dependent epimerase/dehydratase family protein [Desulfocapsaceae bacterium]
MNRQADKKRKLGVIIGGSGLIGGTLVHYFKTQTPDTIEARAPSSKKVSIRSEEDIYSYLLDVNPEFVVNAAIANLGSSSQLSLEVNYLGTLNLAKAAAALKIPYIHLTTAATLPAGSDIQEDQHLAVTANLNNYAKSKLMAEKTLEHLRQTVGLDYTSIRLAIVYGDHDHKIQGFHRLFFSVADQAMPFLFTRKRVVHSYTNSRKLPYFVHHILENREEFSGQTYNFVDKDPVELASLILGIKKYLRLKYPREIYVPYGMAKSGMRVLSVLLRGFAKMGLVAQMPQELMFLESFYQTQTLSTQRLQASSFVDPLPKETVFTRLPDLASYYLKRWREQNIITDSRYQVANGDEMDRDFCNNPQRLLEMIHESETSPMEESDRSSRTLSSS